MSEVLVVSMSKEQLNELFAEKIEEVRRSLALVNNEYKRICDHKVDRNYLRENFKWRRTRIERFEAEGRLIPFCTGDEKTHYYTLSDCIKLDLELRS